MRITLNGVRGVEEVRQDALVRNDPVVTVGDIRVTAEQDDHSTPPRPRADGRPGKDAIRRAFGDRVVRPLLESAGTSPRAFEARHGIDHSRVSHYKNGQRMPPLEVMEALVRDARTYGGLDDEAARQAFTTYRATLAHLGTPDGSDQNSLLLRIYDLTRQVTETNHELQTLRAYETDALAGVGEPRQPVETEPRKRNDSDAKDSAAHSKRRPRQRGEDLAALRTNLLERRAALIAELTQCQTLRLERERPAEESVADGPCPRSRARRRDLFAVAAVTTAALALITHFLPQTDRPDQIVTHPGSKDTRTPSPPPKPAKTGSSPSASPSTAQPPPTETTRNQHPPAGRDTTTPPPDNSGGGTFAGSADGNNGAVSPSCAGNGGFFGGADALDCPNPTPTPSDPEGNGYGRGGPRAQENPAGVGLHGSSARARRPEAVPTTGPSLPPRGSPAHRHR